MEGEVDSQRIEMNGIVRTVPTFRFRIGVQVVAGGIASAFYDNSPGIDHEFSRSECSA